MCYRSLGCTVFWANVMDYVIILCICHGVNISLSGEFCGVPYWCNFGVYCLKGGFAALSWSFLSAMSAVLSLLVSNYGVLGSK